MISGHVHRPSAVYSSDGAGGVVNCVAPALFTRKSETLGYSYISLDHGTVTVSYRQWVPTSGFVAGTTFSGEDTGVKHFSASSGRVLPSSLPSGPEIVDTLAILQEEFDEAITSYSSKKRIWVERDLSASPETRAGQDTRALTTASALAANFRQCVIRAPKQFGLTCLGRFVALQYSKANVGCGAVVMLTARLPNANLSTQSRFPHAFQQSRRQIPYKYCSHNTLNERGIFSIFSLTKHFVSNIIGP